MKVCLYQNYSSNNQKLFDLTVGNHLKYCAVNGYSALFDNGPYSAFVNTYLIKALLEEYDFVFTAGSDCIFTERTPIHEFLDKDHDASIQEEGIGGSWLNGEVILYRASDRCMELLDYLELERQKAPDAPWGTQSIMNRLLETPSDWAKVVQVFPPGLIQKYVSVHPRNGSKRLLWTPGTLIAHAIGGNLEQKTNACNRFLASGSVKL